MYHSGFFYVFHIEVVVAFYLLGLSIILAFTPLSSPVKRVPVWCFTFLAAIVLGVLENVLDIKGLLVVLAYTLMLIGGLFLRLIWLRRLIVCLFGVFSLVLAMHLLPGFYNEALVLNQKISTDAVPFSLYANFDKGLVGLFLLVYFFRGQARANYYKKLQNPKEVLVILILTPVVALAFATLLGLIQFDLKVPGFWLSFLAINLLFTCVAEEVFFRGFLQRGLSVWLEGKLPLLIAPIFSALIFALVHIAAGIEYALVAGVAGLGYSYLFYRTKRIEWSILCHFILNVTHFFLFTYPMLA
ncbi:CPBP family intramembrane glutamic endopeptidase [Marinomonas sp. CT5]|uniref:CPBP family intramembrane glutamic endopeptidase n=1 Tax=Marinomonas sp. CT5 TaxID=2066133 RepID=UPI001BAF8298|nr:CPBP family intramembrane glutamic endopeptidase [Marinomonas sp. CT5]